MKEIRTLEQHLRRLPDAGNDAPTWSHRPEHRLWLTRLQTFLNRRQLTIVLIWAAVFFSSVAILAILVNSYSGTPIEPRYSRIVFDAAIGGAVVSSLFGLFLYVIAGLVGWFNFILWLRQRGMRRSGKAVPTESRAAGSTHLIRRGE